MKSFIQQKIDQHVFDELGYDSATVESALFKREIPSLQS